MALTMHRKRQWDGTCMAVSKQDENGKAHFCDLPEGHVEEGSKHNCTSCPTRWHAEVLASA